MDSVYPPEAWKRLGTELQKRRGKLGYGFRQRDQFLRDRGGPSAPSLKMIARLERGERTTYPPATVAALESLYDLEPGSLERCLQGGDLSPGAGVSLSPVPDLPPAYAPGDVMGEIVDRLLDLGGDPEVPPGLWVLLRRLWRLKQDDRADLLLMTLRSRDPLAREAPGQQGKRRDSPAS